MQKPNPTTVAVFLATVILTYYGLANYFLGSVSKSALIIGLLFICFIITVFLKYGLFRDASSEPLSFLHNIIIIVLTVISLYGISFFNYVKTGMLLGSVIGGLAGGVLIARDKNQLLSNRRLALVVIGVVLFVISRDITVDVLTMGSSSLAPRVQKGQKILVNNLSFGLLVPFLPYHVVLWGTPAIHELVVVTGPNGRPFVREVLSLNGNMILINIDGWVSRERLLARAIPL